MNLEMEIARALAQPDAAIRRSVTPSFSMPGIQGRELTYDAVRDERIEVAAQHSLVRLSKKTPTGRRAANEILAAVKSGELMGIYQENQAAPARRARAAGGNWWEVTRSQDAIMQEDPYGLEKPILVFSATAANDVDKERLDRALVSAWLVTRPVTPAPHNSGIVYVPHRILGFVAIIPHGRPRNMRRNAARAREYREVERVQREIMGTDHRVIVGGTQREDGPVLQGPWTHICRLRMFHRGNTADIAGMGTGFLVSPRHVLTAGHCLFNYWEKDGRWDFASSIEVRVGAHLYSWRDNLWGTRVDVMPGWREERAYCHDIGLITLPRAVVAAEAGFGPTTFWGEKGSFTQIGGSLRERDVVYTAGYPGDKCLDGPGWGGHAPCKYPTPDKCPFENTGTTLWQSMGFVRNLNNCSLSHDCDVCFGQSGSPIWVEEKRVGLRSVSRAVGVQSRVTGTPKQVTGINNAVPLRRDVLEWLRGEMQNDGVAAAF